MNSRISVFSAEKKFQKYESLIKKQAVKIAKILKIKNSAIDIFLIGDSQIRSINKKFRGKNKPTNILSFVEPKKFPHPELKSVKGSVKNFIGEIYLNIDTVNDFTGLKEHLKLDNLLAHGLLHLLGYIHNTKNDRMKMEKKEKWLIGKLDN
ncbi:MAG: rRNA maturation RNase YbeY [Candidatus Wolfebacteria bacterium]|nr:rRNA maturation RNase YbeY [Candidatus Wolfebacteria bacterium]